MVHIEARPPLKRTKGEVASTTQEGILKNQPAEGNLTHGTTQTVDDQVDGPEEENKFSTCATAAAGSATVETDGPHTGSLLLPPPY